MNEKLYIIGNGFDLHHGMPTTYKDFGRYLKEVDQETYKFVCDYLAGGDLDDLFWYQFEEALGWFDRDTLEDRASDFLMPYGSDDWSDAYHHNYQYEIEQVANALSVTLRGHFSDWVASIQNPKTCNLSIDQKALYLTFNYTTVLEHLYGIPGANILHIHGAVGDSSEDIILGHARDFQNISTHGAPNAIEVADTRIYEGNQIIEEYFQKTAKPTAKIIASNEAFWSRLYSVKRVSVLGHSLEIVDLPYLKHINDIIGSNCPKWAFSYYGDIEGVRKKVKQLNLMAKDPTVCSIDKAAQL